MIGNIFLILFVMGIYNVKILAMDEEPSEGATVPKRQRSNEICFVQLPINIGDRSDCPSDSNIMKMADLTQMPVGDYGAKNMADLILSRSGIFDWNTRNLENLHVCEHHFKMLGQDWLKNQPTKGREKKRICAVPFISNGPVHGSDVLADRFVTREQAIKVYKQKHVFLKLGTGKCSFVFKHNAIFKTLFFSNV